MVTIATISLFLLSLKHKKPTFFVISNQAAKAQGHNPLQPSVAFPYPLKTSEYPLKTSERL